jgi:hypothetical protein
MFRIANRLNRAGLMSTRTGTIRRTDSRRLACDSQPSQYPDARDVFDVAVANPLDFALPDCSPSSVTCVLVSGRTFLCF